MTHICSLVVKRVRANNLTKKVLVRLENRGDFHYFHFSLTDSRQELGMALARS